MIRASIRLRQRLQEQLWQREQAGLLRRRLVRDGRCAPLQSFADEQRLSFCSNDYLGLAGHPLVTEALQRGAERYGVGSGASALVTGHCQAHQALEEELADFTGRDKAILFATGYMANMGTINALTPIGGRVFQDALNHASLLDGGWLSRGESVRYPHADMQALEALLSESALPTDAKPDTLIVTDGVFSMDGDWAPLPALVSLADKYGAALMVDDAHGIGCLGEQGRGTLEQAVKPGGGMLSQDDVPVLVGTFGKAFGTAGAFVAGDSTLVDYLEQFARTHMFSTAMPPALVEATRASLRLIRSEPWRRERLRELIARFRSAVQELGLPLLPSASPVQAVVLGDIAQTVAASHLLQQHGIQVSAIRPPTVPPGTARLRITLTATHSNEDLQRLLEALSKVREHLAAEA